MGPHQESEIPGYDPFYRDFYSPLMRQIRQEAYGEDIGQHSWVIAAELRGDVSRLNLSESSRFLDLGCGPCGPLCHIVRHIGCRGTGIDLSAPALTAGRRCAASMGIEKLVSLHEVSLNESLPFAADSFDAAMALDVVLHVMDRRQLFREVARVLSIGRRFLFTDAGVITGSLSNEEVLWRSLHGYTQFVASGFNEQILASAGFELLEIEDRTASVVTNAKGRLAAITAHRAELEQIQDSQDIDRQCHYLETVAALGERRALSRIMYLAQSHAA
jgi:SAM-dependent methyltransferase